MREIKFRTWMKAEPDIDLPENWMYYLTKNDSGEVLGDMLLELDDRVIEVMQYTGLKDKNGKEIYEGDIVKMLEKKYEIIFAEGSFGAIGIKDSSDRFPIYKPSQYNALEVIGNIYEK